MGLVYTNFHVHNDKDSWLVYQKFLPTGHENRLEIERTTTKFPLPNIRWDLVSKGIIEKFSETLQNRPAVQHRICVCQNKVKIHSNISVIQTWSCV